MPFSALIWEGLRLMGIGMGIVFAFLLLLIGLLRLLALGVQRFAPAERIEGEAPEGTADAELIAVISAAIHRYRQDHPSSTAA